MSPKPTVPLVIVDSTPIVQPIYQTQGKQRAMEFTSHIVRTASLGRSQQSQNSEQGLKQEMRLAK